MSVETYNFFRDLVQCKERHEVVRLAGRYYPPERSAVGIVPIIKAVANTATRPIEGSWRFDRDSGCEGPLCKAQILKMGEDRVIWLQPNGDYVEFYFQQTTKTGQ